jgi:hypothetical protein
MSSYKTKLLNLKRSQYILYILILSLLMAFIWIGGTLLVSQKTSGITSEVRKAALPLNPNINVQTLVELEGKRVFAPEELSDFPIFMLDRSNDSQSQKIITIENAQKKPLVDPVFEPDQQTEGVEPRQTEQEPIDTTQTQNEAGGDTQEFVSQPLDFVSDGPPTQ